MQRTDLTKAGYGKLTGVYHRILSTIFEYVNATLTIKWSRDLVFFNNDGEAVGLLKDITTKTADIVMFPSSARLIFYLWKIQSYPFSTVRIKFLTSKLIRNPIDVLSLNLDQSAWLLFITIGFASIVCLRHIQKRSMSSAILEFVRILTNGTFLSKPRATRKRILLISTVAATVTVNCFIQCRLSMDRIVPYRSEIVDSIGDLLKSNLTIYGSPTMKDLASTKALESRYRNYDYGLTNCRKILEEKPNVACLLGDIHLPKYITTNIYVSKNSWSEGGVSLILATESPLGYSFNRILLKMSEGGFIILFFDREKNYQLRNREAELKKIEESLNMKNLFLIFYIILGGWILSLFIFFLEIVIY